MFIVWILAVFSGGVTVAYELTTSKWGNLIYEIMRGLVQLIPNKIYLPRERNDLLICPR